MKRIILLIAILFSVSYSFGQDNPPVPAPPPPGLVVPLDTNSGLLLFAGLGLGIYFLVSSGKFSASSKS